LLLFLAFVGFGHDAQRATARPRAAVCGQRLRLRSLIEVGRVIAESFMNRGAPRTVCCSRNLAWDWPDLCWAWWLHPTADWSL